MDKIKASAIDASSNNLSLKRVKNFLSVHLQKGFPALPMGWVVARQNTYLLLELVPILHHQLHAALPIFCLILVYSPGKDFRPLGQIVLLAIFVLLYLWFQEKKSP